MDKISIKQNENGAPETKSLDKQEILETVADVLSVGVSTNQNAGGPLVNPNNIPDLLPDVKPFAMENMDLLSVKQNQVKLNRKEVLQAIQHCFCPDLVQVPQQTIIFGNSGGSSHLLNGTEISTIFADYDPSVLSTQLGFVSLFSKDHGITVPIIGWDLMVKQYDRRFVAGRVTITAGIGEEDYNVVSLAEMDPVFTIDAQLSDVTRAGHITLLPVGYGGTYAIEGEVDLQGASSSKQGVALMLDAAPREASLQVGIPLLSPLFNSLNSSIDFFGFRITGENAVVYVKPIFPTAEVLSALGRACLSADADEYLNTLTRVYR